MKNKNPERSKKERSYKDLLEFPAQDRPTALETEDLYGVKPYYKEELVKESIL